MTKYRVASDIGLNVRTIPSSSNNVPIGVLPNGAIVDVIATTTNGWHELAPVAVSGVTLVKQRAFAFAEYMTPVVAPPIATGKTRLGVNVITGSGDVARRALAAGCNALSIIDGFQLAADLANDQSITVMARRYVRSMPPADPDLIFEGAASPHVVYLTPLNECDVICYGSPEEIARRAGYDR